MVFYALCNVIQSRQEFGVGFDQVAVMALRHDRKMTTVPWHKLSSGLMHEISKTGLDIVSDQYSTVRVVDVPRVGDFRNISMRPTKLCSFWP